MQRTLAVDIPKHIGEDVKLVGWLFQVRELGSISFVVVRDRTGTAQAVILDPSKYDLSHLKRESLVEVYGTVKAEPQAKRGAELLFKEVKVLTEPVAELPFEVNRSKKKLNLKIDSVLDHRAFSLRNPEIAAPFKVQAEIVRTFADYLRGLGLTKKIHTSKIVSAGTEGGTALFPIKYFEQQAFLAQSPQFYKQMLVGAGFERVFEVGFVLPGRGPRDLTAHQRVSIADLEMGFIESYTDVIDVERGFLKQMVENIGKTCADELALLKAELPKTGEFPQIRLKDALAILAKDYKRETKDMVDLDPEGERQICDYA